MLITMYRGYGDNRIYIHGHLNDEEMRVYQMEGWRLNKERHHRKKLDDLQVSKNGIPISLRGVKI